MILILQRITDFLLEPQAQDKAAFEKVLKKFFSCIKEVEDDEGDSNYDGAIMFGVSTVFDV